MRKNQENETQKAFEQSVKTDSEKKDSAKKKSEKKPELNEPLYDISIDKDGNADVVSEKAIEEIDYPPELAEFLGEALRNLHDQLGLGDDEPIPDDTLNEFFGKMVKGEELDDPEDFSDDDLMSADFSGLDKDEYGNSLLASFDLPGPEDAVGVAKFVFSALLGDEDAETCKLAVHVNVPFLKKVKPEELPTKEEAIKITPPPRYLTRDRKEYYLVAENTFQAFVEAIRECGLCGAEGMPLEEAEAHPDGYDPEMMEYWYDDKIYHEKDVIWFELPRTLNMFGRMKGFAANLDSFIPLYVPVDITNAKKIKVENYRRVLSEKEKFDIKYYGKNIEFFEQLLPYEEVWHLASEYAKKQETPGYCVVCLNGKYNVPVESIINPVTYESDDLLEVFNAITCPPFHHRCAGMIIADIGNMQMQTAVRYCNGKNLDWKKRVEQELNAYRLHDSDYNPYDDPYDNPYNADGDW